MSSFNTKKASPLEFAILEKGDTFYYLLFLFLFANCSNTIDYYFVASVTMTRSLVCFANLLLAEYPVFTQKKHLRRDAILEKLAMT